MRPYAICTLCLYQNEVEEIPKEIAVLTLLEVLKLSNNNLEKVHSLRPHTRVA
jgi:Leucine-rich repeat (LRR) protein